MKKLLTLLLVLFSLFVVACEDEKDYDILMNKAIELINIPETVKEDITLPSSVTVEENVATIVWTSNSEAISNAGVVTRQEEDVVVTLKAVITIDETVKEKEYTVTVPKKEAPVETVDVEALLAKAKTLVNFPSEVDETITKVELLSSVEVDGKTVELEYELDNNIITNEGEIIRPKETTETIVKVCFKYEDKTSWNEYTVKILTTVNYEEISKEMLSKIELPLVVDADLELMTEVEAQGEKATLKYTFSSEVIDSTGKVTFYEEDESEVDCTVEFELEGVKYTKEIKGIKVLSIMGIAEKFLESLNIPEETNENINLPTEYKNMEISWSTSNKYIINDKGVVAFVEEDSEVTLYVTCVITYDDEEYFYDDKYVITVKPYSDEKRVASAYQKLNIPSETQNNLSLTKTIEYGVSCEWTSSNEDVLSPNGYVNPQNVDTLVTLTVVLSYGNAKETYTFDVVVKKVDLDGCDELFYMHNLVEYAEDLDSSKMHNLVLVNNRLELAEGATEGYYESKTFKTRNFDYAVGSYSCTSGTDHTAELEISVKVDGAWSKYFSYGVFGNGKENLYYDTKDTKVYLNTDMITLNSGYYGEGIKYRITLRRNTTSSPSPKLLLVAIALSMDNYSYVVDDSDLPKEFDNASTPKLYQHDVPGIGGSICSATTTTMLLMNRGYDFSNKGYAYPHQYMASIVADRGHNNPTYGNWSYNMIAAGGFGAEAYVAKMYSWEELKWYLVNVGPCGASIAGNFGIYTTGGHLIVVRGYREEANGTVVICNDPNVKGVYYEVSKEIFMAAWKKGVSYIVK